jgi:ankyrin repeat protein
MRLLKPSSLAAIGLVVCLLIIGCARNQIRQAVIGGDIHAIEKILRSHPDRVNQRDPKGDTLLHIAAQAGDQQAVTVLLQYGANVEAKNARGETPIEVAAYQGYASVMRTLLAKGARIRDPRMLLRRAAWSGYVEVAQLLVERGTEVNVGDETKQGGERSTPLHAAVVANRPDMVEFLLARGADATATDSTGRTPLHFAAESLYTQIGKMLLAKGAKVNAVSKTGDTPLHGAAKFGRTKMAETLLGHGADVNAKGFDGRTPLDVAAIGHSKPETVDELRKSGGKPSARWELWDVIALGETKEIDRIVASRPSSATEILNGETALHYATRLGSKDAAERLLAHKIDVNTRGYVKQTPLHVAAQTGSEELVRFLLDHGAQINARDKDGLTPLDYLYKFLSPIRPIGGGRVPLKPEYQPLEQLLLTRGAKE